MFLRCDRFTRRKSPFLVHEVRSQYSSLVYRRVHTLDQCRFLGNCPPTRPLSQHYHFSLKAKCWLRGGIGGQIIWIIILYMFVLFTGFLFGSHNDDARSLPRNAKLKELCLTI